MLHLEKLRGITNEVITTAYPAEAPLLGNISKGILIDFTVGSMLADELLHPAKFNLTATIIAIGGYFGYAYLYKRMFNLTDQKHGKKN